MTRSSLQPNVRTRWVIATLSLVLGALAVRVTMLDDTWLRVFLAGGDRMGLLAKERNIRVEAQRVEATIQPVARLAPGEVSTRPPLPEPLP